MIRPVRIDPEAEEEIGAGMLRYERARLGLGLEFLDEVDAALHSIREPGPECGAALGVSPALGVRRKLVARFPYAIVFVVLDTSVRVLAVMHGAQRPAYWRRRLRR